MRGTIAAAVALLVGLTANAKGPDRYERATKPVKRETSPG